jgi:hypothetical protein
VLAFLYRAPRSGDLRVVGMAQGVLPLKDQSGTMVVMPGGGGAALVERGSDGTIRDAPDAIGKPQALSDVVSRIRAILATQQR